MAALFFVFGRAKNLQILRLFQSDGRCPSLKQFDANFAANFCQPAIQLLSNVLVFIGLRGVVFCESFGAAVAISLYRWTTNSPPASE
jgi:hypothetical protein